MSSLLDKMKKASIIKESSIVSESRFFSTKGTDSVPTDIPIINIALSGSIDDGLHKGLTFIAGPSRHFKSMLGLVLIRSYLNSDPEAICVFFDSEFGITREYLDANGIDVDRVIHVPITSIEELKFDLIKKLEAVDSGNKVIFFVDSIGNLASKKELEDAIDGKSVTDMSRAKSLKSLWRMVTPYFTINDIPCIVVNHTYEEQKLYGKQIMSGGQGGMLSANQVFFVGKSQEKEGADLVGYNFTINVEKSRYVKERSKLPFTVTWEGGIQKYSGLMDIAVEAGIVIKPSQGYYQKVNLETGEADGKKYRLKETNTAEFWESVLKSNEFKTFVQKKYKISAESIMKNDSSDSRESITLEESNTYENV